MAEFDGIALEESPRVKKARCVPSYKALYEDALEESRLWAKIAVASTALALLLGTILGAWIW